MCGIFGFLQFENFIPSDLETLYQNFMKIQHRGPDNSKTVEFPNLYLGFHRLAINDLSESGNQPFEMKTKDENTLYLICNGEIYNYPQLKKDYGFSTISHSDCEIILHLYHAFGIEKTCQMLDGYFAFALYDKNQNKLFLARDTIGIRPLFISIGKVAGKNYHLGFASEAKALYDFQESDSIQQFYPSHYMEIDTQTLEHHSIEYYHKVFERNLQPDTRMIYHLLDKAVEKRLMSDKRIGAFLSGGLDSSIIVALIAKYLKEFTCFTVSIEGDDDNADIKHARELVEYLNKGGCNIHLEVVKFTLQQIWETIPELVRTLETFDTTTIRASVCQYLLSHWIKKNTDITVLYSGEGSDEIFCGYKMFRAAPTPEELKRESERLVNELHFFDCLRTDRTTASAGLEVRVPFLDNQFYEYVMNIAPEYKMCYTQPEKYILRKAFEKILPNSVAWRPKEAFSDSVSNEKVSLKGHLQKMTQNEDVLANYHIQPKTQEELYYRWMYNKYYDGFNHLPRYWMPPQEWFVEKLNDPSATVLSCYGDKQ